MNNSYYIRRIKRIFDLSVIASLLVVLAPIVLFIGATIRLMMGKPILFRQVRAGLAGQLFTIYKFRTMSNQTSADGQIVSDSQRITSVGKALRRTRLDELPQLINVLRGEMSLVGPRPLLPEYLSYYSTRQARRHEVLPGLTGWAQIHGGNRLSWEQKFEYDVWYVERVSLRLDCFILWQTLVLSVLSVLRPQSDEVVSHFDAHSSRQD